MNYNLFFKNEKNLVLADVLIIILLITSFTAIILGLSTILKFIVISDLILLFIKKSLEHKNTIKNSNKIIIDNPLVIDNENIYILQDKSGILMLIVAICCFLILLIFKISGNMLHYFSIIIIIIMFEGNDLLKKANIKFLKNNKSNLYNILNSKNNKYNINKIEKITKSDNGTYIINITNQTSKEVIFINEYENYSELIILLDQRCS